MRILYPYLSGMINVAAVSSTMRELAKRYAHALFDTAQEQKNAPVLEAELRQLAALYEAHASLRLALENPLVSQQAKQAIVADIARKLKLSTLVKNTVLLLAQQGRMALLAHVVAAYHERLLEANASAVAHVTAAVPLSVAQQKQLSAQLAKATGKTSVALDIDVDEALLAGLVVRMGSVRMDFSLKSRLHRLQQHLHAARLQ